MPLYELKSARDLEIAIARKLPLRVSCSGGLGCCNKDEIIWDSNENKFVKVLGCFRWLSQLFII